jgi:hypothetical protein
MFLISLYSKVKSKSAEATTTWPPEMICPALLLYSFIVDHYCLSCYCRPLMCVLLFSIVS